MSVRLKDVRMPASQPNADGPLFEGLNVYVEDGTRIGILGTAKLENSMLLRLICGTATAEAGVRESSSRISWPIPSSGFLSANSSAAGNIRFVARLFGIEDDSFPWRIAEMVEIADFLNVPMKEAPKFVKPRLAFALGITVDFDIYLFDGSLVSVDKAFKEKAVSIVNARMADRGYVLAAAVPAEVEQHCDSVYVLESGQATYFASADEGIKHFKAQAAANKTKQQRAGETSERTDDDDDEDEVLGDVNILGTAVADAID